MKLFELIIALRFLRSKRKDSFISVVSLFSFVGIALGVATLIVVMSVMNGYHVELVKNILGIQGHITAYHSNGKFEHYTQFADEVERIKHVEFVAPIIIEPSMFVSEDKATGGIVRGIDPEKLLMKPVVKDKIDFDQMIRFSNHEGVLIGQNLAATLQVGVGDSIKIVTPQISSTLVGGVPRSKTYKIVGVFDVGLYQYNSTTIFMPLTDAQSLYRYHKSVAEVEIMLDDQRYLNDVKQAVYQIGGQSTRLVDWERAQDKWLNALAVERNVMFLILTLIIIVAAFNIISSLIMLVKDKSKSIAVLRTMGASKTSIIRIFVVAGSLIGVMGSLLGVLLGVIIAKNISTIKDALESYANVSLFDPMIYFLTHLPSVLEVGNVVMVFALALGFSVLATIYPAYRASKLMPTEVLRYE